MKTLFPLLMLLLVSSTACEQVTKAQQDPGPFKIQSLLGQDIDKVEGCLDPKGFTFTRTNEYACVDFDHKDSFLGDGHVMLTTADRTVKSVSVIIYFGPGGSWRAERAGDAVKGACERISARETDTGGLALSFKCKDRRVSYLYEAEIGKGTFALLFEK